METETDPPRREVGGPTDLDTVMANVRHALELSTPERRDEFVHGIERLPAEHLVEAVSWVALLDRPRPPQSLDAMTRLRRSLERTDPELWPQLAAWAEHLAGAQDEPANVVWREQIGPALSQADTARLLEKSPQAVHKDRRLLVLRQPGSGRPVYPVFQFHERQPLPGLSAVLAVLRDALLPASIAAWLTSSRPELDAQRPIDVLRGAPQDERVLELARRLAAAAA